MEFFKRGEKNSILLSFENKFNRISLSIDIFEKYLNGKGWGWYSNEKIIKNIEYEIDKLKRIKIMLENNK